jgi:CRISPR-associated exonuclease Cas4
VFEGALYYASSKRRRVVPITPALRQAVAETAQAVRDMLQGTRLPPPLAGDFATQRCRGCSLHDRCQPEAAASPALAAALARLFDPDA